MLFWRTDASYDMCTLEMENSPAITNMVQSVRASASTVVVSKQILTETV